MKEAAKQPEAPAPQAATTAFGLGPTAAGRVLALQRTAGNRAVAQLLARADTTTVS